ncbi:hypothetical protein C4D60_Mb08t24230 [Musa balbisiana]|uniref:Secreted protein n=1 Tax=Musa balbisiana TaxID=52838 RepID=A0A4S8K639_MUSBA|nr:hypothetical protein C4D60_Mb08t24230 [Musa balbisiana]
MKHRSRTVRRLCTIVWILGLCPYQHNLRCALLPSSNFIATLWHILQEYSPSRPLAPMSPLHQKGPMEQHDPALASARVHVLDLCPRKALRLRSMFHLLCRLTSYGLGTSPSYTQVAPLLVSALS